MSGARVAGRRRERDLIAKVAPPHQDDTYDAERLNRALAELTTRVNAQADTEPDLTDTQGLDADLTAIAALTGTGLIERTGDGTAALRTIGAGGATDILTRAAGDSRYQPLDSDLTAVAALSTTGLIERTGAGTAAIRALGVSASTDVLTRADGDGRFQPLDSDLTAIAALATTGLVERTGSGTAAIRALGVSASTDVLTRADGDVRYALAGRAGQPSALFAPCYGSTGGTVTLGSSSARAMFVGTAYRDLATAETFTVGWKQSSAGSGFTWGEVALAKLAQASWTPGSNPSLTVVGYVDASAVMASTSFGWLSVPIDTGQSIDASDTLWVIFAKLSTGSPLLVSGAFDGTLSGIQCTLTTGSWRPSSHVGSPVTWTIDASAAPIKCFAAPPLP